MSKNPVPLIVITEPPRLDPSEGDMVVLIISNPEEDCAPGISEFRCRVLPFMKGIDIAPPKIINNTMNNALLRM
jgi:hypothetical protein